MSDFPLKISEYIFPCPFKNISCDKLLDEIFFNLLHEDPKSTMLCCVDILHLAFLSPKLLTTSVLFT